MNIKDFPLSADGYNQAIQWMEENGMEPTDYPARELVTDGYTIINMVNHLRQRPKPAH